jgi:hypothetical protein
LARCREPIVSLIVARDISRSVSEPSAIVSVLVSFVSLNKHFEPTVATRPGNERAGPNAPVYGRPTDVQFAHGLRQRHPSAGGLVSSVVARSVLLTVSVYVSHDVSRVFGGHVHDVSLLISRNYP